VTLKGALYLAAWNIPWFWRRLCWVYLGGPQLSVKFCTQPMLALSAFSSLKSSAYLHWWLWFYI